MGRGLRPIAQAPPSPLPRHNHPTPSTLVGAATPQRPPHAGVQAPDPPQRPRWLVPRLPPHHHATPPCNTSSHPPTKPGAPSPGVSHSSPSSSTGGGTEAGMSSKSRSNSEASAGAGGGPVAAIVVSRAPAKSTHRVSVVVGVRRRGYHHNQKREEEVFTKQDLKKIRGVGARSREIPGSLLAAPWNLV